MQRWVHLVQSSAGEEGALKTEMSCRRREVLFGKKLVLFKKLMVESDHTDLFDNFLIGFDLTGALPESNVFSKSVKPSSLPPFLVRV